jgi:hypothetical protein
MNAHCIIAFRRSTAAGLPRLPARSAIEIVVSASPRDRREFGARVGHFRSTNVSAHCHQVICSWRGIIEIGTPCSMSKGSPRLALDRRSARKLVARADVANDLERRFLATIQRSS